MVILCCQIDPHPFASWARSNGTVPTCTASSRKRNSAILPDRVFFLTSKLDMQRFSNFKRKALRWATFLLGITFLSAHASEIPAGVSLSRTTGNHLFVPVRINHRPAWFAVDTGAALTIVDSNRANTFVLSVKAQVVQSPPQIELTIPPLPMPPTAPPH